MRRLIALLGVLLVLAGCSGGGQTGGPPVIRSLDEYNRTVMQAQDLSAPHLNDIDLGAELTPQAEANLREAARLFEGVIAFQPTLYRPIASVGRIYQVLGDHDRAVARFEQALRLQPQRPSPDDTRLITLTRFFLSLSYFAKSDFLKAAEQARLTTEADPKNPDFWTALGSAQIQLKQDDLALESLQRAQKLDPSHERSRDLIEFLKKSSVAGKS